MGRLIISETERKNILSLYEATTVAPPPSESVLVVKKNPFKYSEYESARRTYSANLKDGDMFYEIKDKSYYDVTVIDSFVTDFTNKLNNKTLRAKNSYGEDYIVTFYGPIDTSKKWDLYDGFIGKMELKLNDRNPQTYSVYFKKVEVGAGVIGSSSTNQKVVLYFNNSEDGNNRWSPTSYPQINELLNKEYNEFVIPKMKLENVPDNYFEIRKIQRQQTDF